MEVKVNTKDSVTTAQLIGRLDTPASQEVSGDFDNLIVDEASMLALPQLIALARKITKRITGFLNLFEIQD